MKQKPLGCTQHSAELQFSYLFCSSEPFYLFICIIIIFNILHTLCIHMYCGFVYCLFSQYILGHWGSWAP